MQQKFKNKINKYVYECNTITSRSDDTEKKPMLTHWTFRITLTQSRDAFSQNYRLCQLF